MPGVAMEGITKYYPASGVLANDGACLAVADREIHALVGENGAGKTTLMRVLYGLERPDSGTVAVGGREVEVPSPAAAARLGIGMVQQHFTTVPGFTVAENLVLGREPLVGGLFLDSGRALREAKATIEANGFGLDPRRSADSLSVGERQQLEIVKLLHGNAEILILDEPTAVLTEQEIRALFATLRRLRDTGKTVVLITHKLREVKEVSDTVTVMRSGRTVGRFAAASVGESELACLMVGKRSCETFTPGRSPSRARILFELREVSLRRGGRGRAALDSVSLDVAGGEILGLCGVAGNGLAEIEDLASGLTGPSSGQVLFGGRPMPRRRRPGLGYVPSDRMGRGACLEASVRENLAALDRDSFFPRGLADRRAQERFAADAIGRFSIKARTEDRMLSLSGGNVQKAILARELTAPAGAASFLLVADPTWGLDVASTDFVHEKIVEARDSGAAVLLISSNLDEVLDLADRVAVVYKGRIVCGLANDGSLTRERLGEYMLGLRDGGSGGPGHGRG